MALAFSFTSTHQDLLDSYEAYHTARTGIGPLVRVIVVAFGFLWLLGLLFVLASDVQVDTWWQPIAWLGIGLLIPFHFLVRPQLAKRRIRKSNPPTQELGLTFEDSGIDVHVVGVGRYQRSWGEIAGVINAPKGIVLMFTDGSAHWIPDRVFKGPAERNGLADFIANRIPSKDDRAA